mmetsp:Transcript_31756/g.53564  ORF Transcript_31756/g.53564 Transcript_31756/m.53564 type:complete len:250 (+) Transcript_31756:75-824(+)
MRGAVEEERPSANSVQSRVLNEKDLDELAESNGWTKMKTKVSANQGMVAYKKGNNRLNFWLTTGTCSSSLQHPTQGKTQLFRRQINITEADEIFKNPRKHTGKGYKDNAEREYNLERNQYREQSMLGEKRSRRRGDSDDEEMDLEEEMRPAKRAKISCWFGIACNDQNCPYEHRCRYGKICRRTDCHYDHSGSDDGWWYSQPCNYGASCSFPGCKFVHPTNYTPNPIAYIECKFGALCTRLNCWYAHEI